MKKFFYTLLLVFVAASVSTVAEAQRKSTVSGVVADADTGEGLIGVLVGFTPASDSTVTNHIVTGAGGTFSIGLAPGDWNLSAKLMSYGDVVRAVAVPDSRVALDTIYMRAGIEMDAVVMQGVQMRSSVSGDTLIYNADAYKVAADADVSGLLEKMPGIKVEGGAIEAQGEPVRKVLIDGREFFGEDVNAAISSLPAEAVKSLEVFDKLSDNAEFTGIDDGEGYKAINIVTRESMRQGIMGQVSALYGLEPVDADTPSPNHYGLVGGNVSLFHGDAKLTLGGTFNNLNERHFTINDMLGAGDSDGVGNVGRVQLNYIDIWGKKDQWKFDATYTYDSTNPRNRSVIDREYFESENAIYRNYHSESSRQSHNQGHNFRSRIDFKPNEYHDLRIRPSVSFQGNNSNGNGLGTYFPIDGSDQIDLESWNDSRGKGWDASLGVNYRVRLGKPGRTMSLFFDGRYGSTDRKGESYSERQDGTSRRQYAPSLSYNYRIRSGVTYTEPISENSLINLDYNLDYRYQDQDRKSYLWDALLGDYDMSLYDPELSGIYNNGYLVHRIGPGYRMQKGGTSLAAGVSYQYSTLASDRVLPVTANPSIKADFSNVTYSVLLDTKLGKKDNSLWIRLNSNTNNPGVNDLQDVVDISDVQNIRKGNSGLKPSYNNILTARIIIPNVAKGRTLSINFGGNYNVNDVTTRVISDSPGYEVHDSEGNLVETLDAVGRFIEPINMDGNWSGRFGVGYGFPVLFLKSNMNIDANVMYGQEPSQAGLWTSGMSTPVYMDNFKRELNTGGRISLGSNISERVDFYVSYGLRYRNVQNTFFQNSNNEELIHTVRADFKFVLPLDFTISGDLMYNNHKSISGSDLNRQYFIANAGIGKKVLRSKRAEVSLFVNDIFNQNDGFRRSFSTQWLQNSTNSIIGRYFGVKFTWNIRKFGKNGSQNIEMYETGGGDRSRGGGGGERGGFGGGQGGPGGGRR